ncbi:MAG: ClpXP protease specificity-enhancing factor [Xanthomonadales bacterium]|nr:ClpXP protease specificity-enhancing factor [Xanthomonadales bacterium]MCB1634385.1 ClpXP protease specificity-enhancing factor [Xanthomonadales bacterium]MCB1641167.1 ClpXP protease specificity-enhancing factor [Xanthomonadales bacterium]
MTSTRPYLLRALYQWVLDNDCTPHVLIDASMSGVQVPASVVKDGQVVLNISPTAVAHLDLGNEAISLNARFGGVSHRVRAPVGAVLALYARENGQGMMFPPEQAEADTAVESVEESPGPVIGDDSNPVQPPPRGRPSLKIVK